LSAKSAITVSVPDEAFADSACERYMARCLSPLRAISASTALPTVPLAPVTKIIGPLLNMGYRERNWRSIRFAMILVYDNFPNIT
jgi:hypothetical protein